MTKKIDSDALDNEFAQLGFVPLDRPIDSRDSDRTIKKIEQRRRAWQNSERSHLDDVLSLVESPDGVLRWHLTDVQTRRNSRRAGRQSRAALPQGKIERQYAFEKLQGANQVAKLVAGIDDKCTNKDKRGLWVLSENFEFDVNYSDIKEDADLKGKNVLLFIHGTFSHGDTTCQQIKEATNRKHPKFGLSFLKKIRTKYDRVLSFNHPTLSVSPMVNAFRLAAELRDAGVPKSIDIICHSRGGVVTRWWLEGFASQDSDYRVVFLGAPLGGTSLASPTHLKSGMNLISNYAQVTGKGLAMTANPILMAAGSVFSVIGSIAKVGAKAPVLDAACAVFPGLMGQARTKTNFEINNLRASLAGSNPHQNNYYAVINDFKPSDLEKWKFWKVFSEPKTYVTNLAEGVVDELIFSELDDDNNRVPIANDMVVDCNSMTELSDQLRISPDNVLDFKTKRKSSVVHHTNYVVQYETLEFILKVFKLDV